MPNRPPPPLAAVQPARHRYRPFYRRFLFEDVPTPSGTIDILFEVLGLPTPQGP